MNKVSQRLGVDFGGVILDFVPHIHTSLSFDGPRYLETPPVAGAIDSLRELNETKFANSIFIVSRYGPEDDGSVRVIEWLHCHNFFNRTGIPEEHFHSCAEWHEKLPIAKELKLTHFVDDRSEVLKYMIEEIPNLYLFQALEEKEQFLEVQKRTIFVDSWKKLTNILLK